MIDTTEKKPTHRLTVTYSSDGEVSGTIKFENEDRQHGFYFGRNQVTCNLENGYSIVLDRKAASIRVAKTIEGVS